MLQRHYYAIQLIALQKVILLGFIRLETGLQYRRSKNLPVHAPLGPLGKRRLRRADYPLNIYWGIERNDTLIMKKRNFSPEVLF
ncbi:hypothetical protein X474_24475 [Dethiosulfatarculus sandiegensis]|uniref:Uncharacterized protein n=1 Tax=Dethiosulfatarculus sandiegensis TaxID=1429043 RepID=A0A0D2HLX0_9BACT|nr:hypothetical protein X474_24475 [Dethiosulfatarculus sandiegensis]